MTPGRHEHVFWVVTALVGLSYGQFPDAEYCSIPCARGQHTMCKYKTIGPNCDNVKSLMSENGRMKILSLHNSFRNALASGELKTVPTSSNMKQMYWDLELEAIAERWALQCNASFNDECRDVNRFPVGQIMSKSNIRSPNVNYYEALLTKLWFSEIENLNQAIITNYRKEREVKHIAQILSANTMRIGCADVLYSTIHDQKQVRVTICNYGPLISGNEPIYRVGKPCTECPQRTECRDFVGKYPHLCSELRHFDVQEPEKNFDVVQRDYDDEDMNNVVVESKIFRKGSKDDYFNNRRKNFRNQVPAKSEAIVGGRALEDAKMDKTSTDEYEGEGIGMAEEQNTPAAQAAGEPGAPPVAQSGAPPEEKKPEEKPENPPADPKGGETKQIPIIPSFGPMPGNHTFPPFTFPFPTSGESSFKPADVLHYLIGHAIIVLTTIGLQR